MRLFRLDQSRNSFASAQLAKFTLSWLIISSIQEKKKGNRHDITVPLYFCGRDGSRAPFYRTITHYRYRYSFGQCISRGHNHYLFGILSFFYSSLGFVPHACRMVYTIIFRPLRVTFIAREFGPAPSSPATRARCDRSGLVRSIVFSEIFRSSVN